MNWLKRSQFSVEDTIMGVILGNKDVNVAQRELSMANVQECCAQIKASIGLYPDANSVLNQLLTGLRCNDMENNIQMQQNQINQQNQQDVPETDEMHTSEQM